MKPHNISLLYVEDDESLRESYGDFFKRRAMNYLSAENGKVGLELFSVHHPDIIVTDIKMPEMDGIEMIRNIREVDREVTIVVTSAFNDQELLFEAINLGVTRYAIKPIQRDNFRRLLDESIELIMLRKEKEVYRKELEAMLIQQSKMAAMGEMMAAIAHQWKQPLNAISLIADYLLDQIESNTLTNEKLAKHLYKTSQQVVFLNDTINDFRNFFKPSTEKKRFLPGESLKSVKEMFQDHFEKYNVTIDIHEYDIFETEGYLNEFIQVALNLFNNSRDVLLEKGRRDGRIDCFITREGDTGILRIRDNGGGIPEELLPDRLFEPYVTTKGEGGTGIGLQISKTIIESKMSGRLRAHNVDEGAEFVIELPVLQTV